MKGGIFMNYLYIVCSALMCFALLGTVASAEEQPGEILVEDVDTEVTMPSEVPLDGQTPITPVDVTNEEAVVAEEIEGILKERIRADGVTRAFYGHGWITDGEEGYVLQALWLRNHVDNLDDLPEHERKLAMMGGGVLRIGTGSNVYLYRLIKQPSPADEIVFDVRPLKNTAANSEAVANEMGTLHIARDPYTGVSTWEGKLVLPGKSDSYEVDIGTRSVPVEDMDRIDALIDQRNENGFARMKLFKTLLDKMQSVFN